MHRLLLLFLIFLPLLTITSQADQCVVSESPVAGYGYSFGGDDESTGAYLGIDIADVTPERLSALKLKDEHGVEVTIVDQDAPAGKAGIREHDVILTMNGTTVESGAQLRRMIRETPPGRVVTLGISRDGLPMTIKVQLADRRKSGSKWSSNKDIHIEMPPMPPMPDFDVPVSVVVVHSSMRSGLAVENITPQLGDFFGVKGGKGVLVRSVERGSRAEKAGFRAGDIIVKVNDQVVADTSDFSHAIRSKANGPLGVVIIRDKKEQTLSLPLPERRDSGDLFQETYDLPDMDAETTFDLSQVQNEMARMTPQMQLALDETRRNVEETRSQIEEAARVAATQYRAEVERAREEARAATEQARRELCRQQREMERQKRNMQEQLKHQREELQKQNRKQMERLRHEMQGDWISI
jgi:flagellar biosynthesis GTPase FlhF